MRLGAQTPYRGKAGTEPMEVVSRDFIGFPVCLGKTRRHAAGAACRGFYLDVKEQGAGVAARCRRSGGANYACRYSSPGRGIRVPLRWASWIFRWLSE